MDSLKLTASVIALAGSTSFAEVVTGLLSDDHISTGTGLVGAGLEFFFDGTTHDGTSFSYLNIINSDNPWQQHAAFAHNSVSTSAPIYAVGEYVRPGTFQDSAMYWGTSSYDYYTGDTYNYFVGEVGESLYIGFVFDRELGDGTTLVRNYGFIQLFKVNNSQYSTIGYAYESDADSRIQVFNLVPAPSGVAFASFGLILFGRRNRRLQK